MVINIYFIDLELSGYRDRLSAPLFITLFFFILCHRRHPDTRQVSWSGAEDVYTRKRKSSLVVQTRMGPDARAPEGRPTSASAADCSQWSNLSSQV